MLSQSLPSWKSLSLAEQVAQMIVVRASGHLFDHQIQYPAWEPSVQILKQWLNLGVGGVILLGGSAAEVGLRTQQLQDWAKIPLLVAADIEEGVGQRFAGAVWFPPPMTLGAIAAKDLALACTYAEQMGAATAQEALAIGINWVLAPVVDVNNNPANPVINLRAWGETPEIVSHLTTAFIRGAKRYPVLTAAKHFPGHGDTATDSHLELPVIPHDATRLETVELVPFQAAIAAGVDAVMTAHLQLPVWDAEAPATLSRPILTGLLRQSLQFPGLIVTDALMMGAITKHYGPNEAAVRAVVAGADLLLMPVDPVGAIAAICEAVAAGRIETAQIEASVARIWQAKQKVAFGSIDLEATHPHAWETAPAPIQLDQIAQAQTLTLVNEILEAALVHRPPVRPAVPPVSPAAKSCNLILVDDALNCAFLNRQAPAIALPQQLGYELQVVDSYSPQPDWTELTYGPTMLQLFIRGNPFRSSSALIDLAQRWLQFLLQPNQPSRLRALAVYGSPYLLQQIAPQLPPDLPYVFSHAQIPAAQTIALKALLGTVERQRRVGEFTD